MSVLDTPHTERARRRMRAACSLFVNSTASQIHLIKHRHTFGIFFFHDFGKQTTAFSQLTRTEKNHSDSVSVLRRQPMGLHVTHIPLLGPSLFTNVLDVMRIYTHDIYLLLTHSKMKQKCTKTKWIFRNKSSTVRLYVYIE